MLYEEKQLPELFNIKHRHDSKNINRYEDNLLKNSISPYMYKNNLMSVFLTGIELLTSILFDHMSIIKNLKNYIVDKNYYDI